MPNKCCVPGCNSNYSSFLKDSNNKAVSVFKFPKDTALKLLWIKAIPRKNFEPSNFSVVCKLHFKSSDFIYDKHLQPDGTCKDLILNRPRLRNEAIPSIFPNLPFYLSKEKVKERTDRSSPIFCNTEAQNQCRHCGTPCVSAEFLKYGIPSTDFMFCV